MGEFQLVGVQGLALYDAVIRIVEKISWKRVPDVLHVHPNLVGTTGFREVRLKNMPGENLFSVRPKQERMFQREARKQPAFHNV